MSDVIGLIFIGLPLNIPSVQQETRAPRAAGLRESANRRRKVLF